MVNDPRLGLLKCSRIQKAKLNLKGLENICALPNFDQKRKWKYHHEKYRFYNSFQLAESMIQHVE